MIEYQKAREILTFIDPISSSYSEWIQIGMALKNSIGEAGLNLWDDWSSRDPERYKIGECEKKWKSFKENGDITEATLIYKAQINGWINSSKQHERQKKEPDKPELSIMTINYCTTKKDNRESLISALGSSNGTFKNLIIKAKNNLEKNRQGYKYLKDRSLSEKSIHYFNIGSLEDFKYEYLDKKTGEQKYYTVGQVILIPGSYEGYGVRNISKKTGDKGKYLKTNSSVYPQALDIPVGLRQVTKEPNKRNLETGYREPVFICEGYLDAPSFYEVGADAISLNGTGHIDPIIEAFDYFKVNRPLILALDNDEEGKKAQKDIFSKLVEQGIEVYRPENIEELYGNCKDANESLINNRERFQRAVKKIKYLPSKKIDDNLNYRKIKDFNAYIKNSLKYPPIPTGFNVLDGPDYLDGGLYPGLYILGALSSVGKTTFMLQIADHIASLGIPVLYVSLEMLAHELRAKSISRYIYDYVQENEMPERYAKTVREILDGRRYSNYSELEKEIITDCGDQYFRDTGRQLLILEAESEELMTVQKIKDAVKLFLNETGKSPVVFIDYLQLLDPPVNEKYNLTDKQVTDKNVKALKQLSRDFNIPVFLISSFNRENYNQPVNMASFKESGAIEYSSDVLLGLENNYIVTDQNFSTKSPKEQSKIITESKKKAKEKAMETGKRGIRLVLLKNRNGKSGTEINYEYATKYNHYREFTSDEWEKIKQTEIKKLLKKETLKVVR